MECTCFTGYCEADIRATEWELLGIVEPDDNLISENDLPIGAYDDDMEDIGIHLAAYVAGYRY